METCIHLMIEFEIENRIEYLWRHRVEVLYKKIFWPTDKKRENLHRKVEDHELKAQQMLAEQIFVHFHRPTSQGKRKRQDLPTTTWRNSTGMCYLIPLIHQALFLFSSMGHKLNNTSKNGWFASKSEDLLYCSINKYLKKMKLNVANHGLWINHFDSLNETKIVFIYPYSIRNWTIVCATYKTVMPTAPLTLNSMLYPA